MIVHTGYSLHFTKHYIDTEKVVSEHVKFKSTDRWLLDVVVAAIEKHGEDNPGTDQATGELFWIDGIEWLALYSGTQ